MNERFDSEQINVEYRKDDGIVLVVLKGNVFRDDYRTPMMHAADMVMRHSCKIMAVEVAEDLELDESDRTWNKKVFLSNLKQNGLETIAFIDSAKRKSVEGWKVFCEDKFTAVVCGSYDEVKALTGGEGLSSDSEQSDEFLQMTREEALEYMGLSNDADIKEIDDRFWQMSKKYRGKDDPESKKLEDEISTVYDIASGRRDRRLDEKRSEENDVKIFGRSKRYWDNFFHYNWKNIVLGLVVGISAILVILGVVKSAKSECAVVLFGNMNFDNTFMREALIEDGLNNPYVACADLVVPNDEDYPFSESGNETFSAMFYISPDVLISDSTSYLYYYSTFKDLSPLYDSIMAGLSDEAKAGIQPVYMSEQESVKYNNILYLETGFEEEEMMNPDDFSDEPILIGFEISDPQIVIKLGVDAKWKSRETTLVFGQSTSSKDDEMTVKIITALINAAFAE